MEPQFIQEWRRQPAIKQRAVAHIQRALSAWEERNGVMKRATRKVKRTKIPTGPSALETAFRFHWGVFTKRPFGRTEFQFDPTRRWRFDVAWPEEKIAVEIHGGTNNGGRHVRPKGIRNDCRKINAATLQGWRVLVYTSDDLNERPAAVVAEVELLLTMAR